ncbi:MAG: phage minor head protein [Desulfuromonadales bacterium]
MPTEIDKALFNDIIHHNIAIGRYSDQQIHDIVNLLNKADADILSKIAAYGEKDNFTSARLKALLKEIKAMNADAYDEANKRLSAEMQAFAQHSSEVATGMLASQLPVSWSPVAMTAEQLAAIVSSTPISVGPDKKLLLEEIFSKLAAGKEENIRGALRLGMVEGETVDQMIRRLRGTRANRYKDGVLEISRRDAAAVVRSTVISTGNLANMATFEANSDVLKGWVYIGTLDSRMCSVCAMNYGKTFPLGDGPLPIRHLNCRCIAGPAIKTWEELGFKGMKEFDVGTKASAGGLVRADMIYPDWLKGQPAKVQDEILGKARGQLFRDGKIKLDKYTDASGKMITLDELKGVGEKTASSTISSFPKLNDIKAAELQAKQEFGLSLASYRKLHPEVADEINSAIQEFKDKYGAVHLDSISTKTVRDKYGREKFWMEASAMGKPDDITRNHLIINLAIFENQTLELVNAKISEVAAKGTWVPTELKQVVAHELAHVKISQGITMQEAMRKNQRLEYTFFKSNGLSRYGAKDGAEGIAESFAKHIKDGNIDGVTLLNMNKTASEIIEEFTGVKL